ncbi:VCBS repeat-containing protein, partial [bacterium]|nr:VCBS repeat-containing protein [candidate division CSSED10-310 bacterium]
DLDNDGRLDLVIGNLAAREQIFINDGAGFAATATYNNHIVLPTKSVALGDVDGDGDLDLACGTATDYQNVVWFNTGNGSFSGPPGYWESGDGGDTTCVAWVDYDLDGDLDLSAAKYDGPNVIYRNVSGTLSQSPFWTSTESQATNAIAWGLINDDAYPDMVCANYGQPDTIYLSTGTGPVSTTSIQLTSTSRTSVAVAIGDVEPDGDMDIVIGTDLNNPNSLFLNPGNGFSGPVSPSWSFSKTYKTASVIFADLDHDGDLELAFINNNYYAQIFDYSDGYATTADWQSIGSVWANCGAFGDLEADGDLDLAVGIYGNRSGILFNDIPIMQESLTWQSVKHNNTNDLAIGDINNDGFWDAAFANRVISTVTDQGLTTYLNNAGVLPGSPSWSSSANLQYHFTALALLDFVQDGFPELIAASNGNPMLRFNNNLGFYFATPDWTAGESYSTRRIEAIDIDLDSYPDIVLANDNEPLAAFLSNPEQPGSMPSNAGWFSLDDIAAWDLAMADVDNDGDPDLAVAAGFPAAPRQDGDPRLVTPGADLVFFNEDKQLSITPGWSSTDTDEGRAVAWGDVDGDGYVDLLCASSEGTLDLYLNNGGTLPGTPDWTYEDIGVQFTDVLFFDPDGDGDMDLLAGAYQSPSLIFRNIDGDLGDGPVWQPPQANLKTTCVAYADVDADGDSEVILGNYDQPNMLFDNSRTPSGSLPNTPTLIVVEPPAGYTTGDAELNFVLTDMESDPCSITVLYSTTGGGSWTQATPAFGQVTDDLATSPTGVLHQFIWAADTDMVDSETVVVRVVAHSLPAHWGKVLYPAQTATTRPFRVESSPRVRLLVPVDDSADGLDIDIRFHVTEDIPTGGVEITFDWVGGVADVDHSFTALLSPAPAGIYETVVSATDLNDDGSFTTDDHLMHGAVYDVFIEVTDSTGNSGADDNHDFHFDGERPESQVTEPSEGEPFATREVTISGTAQDDVSGSGLNRVMVTVNGTPYQAAGTTQWTYAWTAPTDGIFTAVSLAVDNAGNIEEEGDTVSFLVDTTNPLVTVNQPVEEECITGMSYLISGTATDPGGTAASGVIGVEVDVGDGWEAAGGTTNWTFQHDFPESGIVSFQARALDLAGNQGEPVSRSVLVDRGAPEVHITDPEEGRIVSGLPLVIRGYAIDALSGAVAVQVKLDGNDWIAAQEFNVGNGNWQHSIDQVEQGTHQILARAVDACGLMTAEEDYAGVGFTVDSQPPRIIVGGYYFTNLATDETGTISVIAFVDRTLDPDIESVEMLFGGEPVGLELLDDGTAGDWAAEDGLFTLELSGLECLPPMQFGIELQAVDAAGNSSSVWPYLHSAGAAADTGNQPDAVLPGVMDILAASQRARSAPAQSRPFVLAAGYAETMVSAVGGGTVVIWVIA